MSRCRRIGAALAVVVFVAAPAVGATPKVRTVVEGLEFPTGIAFLPDGSMVVDERPGRVRLVSPDGTLEPEPLATIATTTSGETGLLDAAVPPDVESDPAVYVFATEPDGASNSIWRVPLDRSGAVRVIAGIPAGTYHNGGGVAFGDDGKLYVSNGEEHDDARAQDPQAMGGKVYRYNADGSIPQDNPFAGAPTWALGLRNPFGLTIDPVSGDVWVTENGPSEFDELNHISARGNYGWPEVSGPGCSDQCIDPVLAYQSIIVPTGLAFAAPDEAEGVAGDLFFGSYSEAAIHRVELNAARDGATSDEILVRTDEPVVAVEWGPRGLYFSTPTKIQLIPVGQIEGGRPVAASGSPSPEASPTPEASRSPGSPAGEDGGGWGGAITGLVLAALAFAFFGLRSGMDRRIQRDEHRDPTKL